MLGSAGGKMLFFFAKKIYRCIHISVNLCGSLFGVSYFSVRNLVDDELGHRCCECVSVAESANFGVCSIG